MKKILPSLGSIFFIGAASCSSCDTDWFEPLQVSHRPVTQSLVRGNFTLHALQGKTSVLFPPFPRWLFFRACVLSWLSHPTSVAPPAGARGVPHQDCYTVCMQRRCSFAFSVLFKTEPFHMYFQSILYKLIMLLPVRTLYTQVIKTWWNNSLIAVSQKWQIGLI